MDRPTDAQIKEFWEWFGFKHFIETKYNRSIDMWEYPKPQGIKRNRSYLPDIDLNNLFKYAVPKVSNYNMCKGLEPNKPVFGKHFAQVWSLTIGYGEAYDEDPALALFWAIWEVIK